MPLKLWRHCGEYKSKPTLSLFSVQIPKFSAGIVWIPGFLIKKKPWNPTSFGGLYWMSSKPQWQILGYVQLINYSCTKKGQPHTLTIMISLRRKVALLGLFDTYHKMHVTKSEENNSKLKL